MPPQGYTTSFEGHDDLNLGTWIVTQKRRYDGKGNESSLTDDRLNKMMAINELRKWAEDPLRDDDVRWELMYRATIDYCQQYQQLPPERFSTRFEGHDELMIGKWIITQKQRYMGKGKGSPLTDDRLNKLMAIAEFREWVEDPPLDNDVRWELMYRATIDYCQEHRLLPSKGYTCSFEGYDVLKLGIWVDYQKKRYQGMEGFPALSNERQIKLMAVAEFHEWAEGPLSDADVRWEIHFDLLAEYCSFHHKLPITSQKVIYERKDGTSQELNLGGWLGSHKTAYSGVSTTRITEEKHDKLMQIPEFKSWALTTFGTIRYADFSHAHAKVKKSGSKKKSTLSTQQ